MSARDIARQRLVNQYLTTPTLGDAHTVVATLGAVQAQDYPSAKWALGLRSRELTDAEVERALAAGHIIRTHVLRPTWHFATASDIRWMLALTGPRVKQAMGFYFRFNELDDALCRRGAKVLMKAMEGGHHLTRADIQKVLARAKLDLNAPRRMGIVMRAELDALICSGAKRGKQQTYALFDERVPPTPGLEREEAIARLTKLYFATRSPATLHDFAWWSGLTVADAKRGIAMLEASRDLERREIGERTYWLASDARPAPKKLEPNVAHLLPNYDEYFIGFKDRTAIMQSLMELGHTRKAPELTQHPIVLDGQVIGGWKRTIEEKAGRMIVEMQALTRVNDSAKKALRAAAKRYGEFWGVKVAMA